MSSQTNLKTVHEHLQGALEASERLQKAFDKMLDDTIIIAAELGAKANYEAVIARIRELREIERDPRAYLVRGSVLAEEIERREALAATLPMDGPSVDPFDLSSVVNEH